VREVFQVKSSVKKQMRNRKRRLQRRLAKRQWQEQKRRLFADQNIHYDYSEKVRAGRFGGLGVCRLLVQKIDLADAINKRLPILKRHVPYHESDHILNMTYNILAGGTTLADIELLRNDDTYLDALGVPCIPDPTTEGDFLRRFGTTQIHTLMDVINDKRLLVWQQQPKDFFEHAILDVDGTIAGTGAACKEGMDLSYKGIWGYHPLVVSLANTQEPLFLLNRPGSRPSHEDAAPLLDRSIDLCLAAGFFQITIRGDTDFSQTKYLDGWDGRNIRFVFGIDCMPNLVEKAEAVPALAWQRLARPAAYEVKTQQRTRPRQVKEEVVRRKGYKNIRLVSEDVAEFAYRPGACGKDYRVIVLRKNLVIEKHGVTLEEEVRYFFYITNEREWSAAAVVYFANDRCNQENLIAQLKGGVKALRLPVNTLNGNWAYMVIGALAWSIKAWVALLQPYKADRHALLVMEFKQFFQKWLSLPCQIVRAGRQIIYRILHNSEWVPVLLRTAERFRQLRLT
jgi:hypothetical protein